MNAWTWYWVLWLFGGFLAPELYALYANPNDTFSSTIWKLEGLNLAQPFDFPMWTDVHWVIAAIVWGLFLWLSLHLPFGLLR